MLGDGKEREIIYFLFVLNIFMSVYYTMFMYMGAEAQARAMIVWLFPKKKDLNFESQQWIKNPYQN
jgi:hypothetical protein